MREAIEKQKKHQPDQPEDKHAIEKPKQQTEYLAKIANVVFDGAGAAGERPMLQT